MFTDLTVTLKEEPPTDNRLQKYNPIKKFATYFFDMNAICSKIYRPNIKESFSLAKYNNVLPDVSAFTELVNDNLQTPFTITLPDDIPKVDVPVEKII